MSHPVKDPLQAFRAALERAKEREPFDATAMSLATIDEDGRPSARIVLVKDVNERGVSFYTNLESRKALSIQKNPNVALCIHWPRGLEQVRIRGRAELVSDAEADAYFASRIRGSQLGAWASDQSRPLASREALEARVEEVTTRYEGRDVPRPPYWSGYRVVPERMEFWFGKADRLHDRFEYVREGEGWRCEMLYP